MSSDDPQERAPGETDDKQDGQQDEPAFEPITLDRYLSKRRPAPKTGWLQIISMVAMLGALIMIMLYKDSCGRQVSQLVGHVAPGTSAPASAPTKAPPKLPSTNHKPAK